MTNILLISDTADNISVAWRYFCTKEYKASATISFGAAMENLRKAENDLVAVFYCGNDTTTFIPFYRMLRKEEKTEKTPLIVLSDMKWTKVLTEYVHLDYTCVLGMGVSSAKLSDVVRNAARGEFNLAVSQSRSEASTNSHSVSRSHSRPRGGPSGSYRNIPGRKN